MYQQSYLINKALIQTSSYLYPYQTALNSQLPQSDGAWTELLTGEALCVIKQARMSSKNKQRMGLSNSGQHSRPSFDRNLWLRRSLPAKVLKFGQFFQSKANQLISPTKDQQYSTSKKISEKDGILAEPQSADGATSTANAALTDEIFEDGYTEILEKAAASSLAISRADEAWLDSLETTENPQTFNDPPDEFFDLLYR